MGDPDNPAIPSGYSALLSHLKGRIHSARMRATLAANQELTLLYWDLGRAVLERQAAEGWGAKVIDRLSQDLQRGLPRHEGAVAPQPQIHAPIQ